MKIPFFSRPDPVSDLRAILPELPDIEYGSLVERLDATVRPHLTFLVSGFDQKFLFRARLESPGDGPFPKVGDLGYMPPDLLHFLTTFGRVNKPGEAMFYASTQPFVACAETARQEYRKAGPKGLDLTVSTWRVVEPLLVVSLLASPENLDQMRILEGLGGTPLSRREIKRRVHDARKENARLESAFRAQVPRKRRRAAVELLRFFSDEFARLDAEQWHFKLTNYYKDVALGMPEEIDGIWYESVGYSFQYSNLALTPKAADRKLRFECASAARMEPISQEGTVKFRVLQEDVPADLQGTIAWRQGSREEMDAAHRIASIRSIADLAEAKLAPDRDALPRVSCLGLLVFGTPEAMDSGGRLQADLDELHGKCGSRTLILFAGYGKAVPFARRRELEAGWLFSEGLSDDLSRHVADRSRWIPGGGMEILAFPIVLIRELSSWSVEFGFDDGFVVDWKRARTRFETHGLGDFLSRLYHAAEAEPGTVVWDDRARMMEIMGSVFHREAIVAAVEGLDASAGLRLAGARIAPPKYSVPVRWKQPDQR